MKVKSRFVGRWARFVVSAAGGLILLQALAAGLTVFAAPYLPEGEVIAYVSYGSSSEDIFIRDVSRGAAHNLTSRMDSSHEGEPDWSADGSQLAFSSRDVESNMSDLFVMDMDGDNLRQLTIGSPTYAFSPAWSPGGEQIAFFSYSGNNTDIFVMDADGNHVRSITNTPQIAEITPTWSSDGRRIAFGVFEQMFAGSIHIVEADDSHEQPLIEGGYFFPKWSPDGKFMAFLGQGQPKIFLMEIDTGNLQSFPVAGYSSEVTWLPDARHIAFVTVQSAESSRVYLLDISSGLQSPFPFGGYNGSVPVWRPA